jgi:predicted nucleic acid-binding protein
VKIIVDTNIIFSGLLNTDGKIGDLLFNSHSIFEFYSCSYMLREIENHWEKLKRIPKLTDTQLRESQFKIFAKIHFINEELIPSATWILSEKTTKDIDVDDVDFVALTNYLKGNLWTGDKDLYNGLLCKGI